MGRRNWPWVAAGGTLVGAILLFGYLSHRNFKETIVHNFNTQQAMFTRSLESAIRDHINEEEQDILHLIREMRRSPGGIRDAGDRLPSLYETHLDNFSAIGIFDEAGRILHYTPADSGDASPLLKIIGDAVTANRVLSSSFLTERFIDSRGRSAISLVVPFTIDGNGEKAFYAAGILKIDDYMISHFPSWRGRSMGFVLNDDSGDILSMLNTVHETSPEMKRGNILSPGRECLECHTPSDFHDVVQALRTGTAIHSVASFPGSHVQANRTTLAFPVMNETWSITIFSPFESIQKAIDRNFMSNMALTVLSLLLVAALSVSIQKGMSLRRVAETSEALRRSEETLVSSAQKLKEANRMKDLFTDIVRHDLMNPVSSAKGYGEILARGESDKSRLELFEAMGRSLNRLAETIENSSVISKLGDMRGLELQRLDLSEIIDRAAGSLAGPMLDKNLGLVRSMRGNFPVAANPILEEVFVNLLSNAVKYSSPGGRIEIGIRDRGADWEAYVRDWGEGIPDAHKEKVFTRLERLQKDGVKGTGLGLAIVRRIMELHGGRVRVEDNPEGGCDFIATIPKHPGKDRKATET